MKNTFKPEVKALILLHTAMLIGQLLFATIVYFLFRNKTTMVEESTSKILQSIAAVLTLGGSFAAFFVFRKSIEELQLTSGNFNEKMNAYRASSIIKFALLETPSLFSIIGFIITNNITFMLLSVVLILVFAGQKPTVPMMMHDMNIGRDELFE
jgi:hypothetical protein